MLEPTSLTSKFTMSSTNKLYPSPPQKKQAKLNAKIAIMVNMPELTIMVMSNKDMRSRTKPQLVMHNK